MDLWFYAKEDVDLLNPLNLVGDSFHCVLKLDEDEDAFFEYSVEEYINEISVYLPNYDELMQSLEPENTRIVIVEKLINITGIYVGYLADRRVLSCFLIDEYHKPALL